MAQQLRGTLGASVAGYLYVSTDAYPQNPPECIRELNLPGCYLTITHVKS